MARVGHFREVYNRAATIALVITLFAGISLVSYPSVSDWWNRQHASRAISTYDSAIEDLSKEKLDRIEAEAVEYNLNLVKRPMAFEMTGAEEAEYAQRLTLDGASIMGSVQIERIDVDLPIYHGTSDGVLQVGIGHLEGTSLPVGGRGTHSVLVGHRGLPSAELLSKLDKLALGDTFSLAVLGKELWYEVDQILIVEPDDLSALAIEEDQDYCTLLTCTPYGINTHRLLVRGHRVDGPELSSHVVADAVRVEPVLVASVVAAPVLAVLAIASLVRSERR